VACSITGIGPFFELEEDEELTVMGEVAEIFISVLARELYHLLGFLYCGVCVCFLSITRSSLQN
jgi:hypothetical protein